MREQHLDFYGIRRAILNPLASTGQGDQNVELRAAMARAINEWQLESGPARTTALKASVVVPYEDGASGRRRDRRRAGNKHFAQVLMLSRTSEPLGKRRYWPIYEAAGAAGLPVGIHVFGYSGWPVTAAAGRRSTSRR